MAIPTLTEWVDITKAFGTAVAAITGIIGCLVGWRSRKKINRVYVAINSRLDQLLIAEHARGRLAERTDIAAGIVPNPAQLTLDIPQSIERLD